MEYVSKEQMVATKKMLILLFLVLSFQALANDRTVQCKVDVNIPNPCEGLDLTNNVEQSPFAAKDPYAKQGIACDYDFSLPGLPNMSMGKFSYDADVCHLMEGIWNSVKNGLSMDDIRRYAGELQIEMPSFNL